MRQDDPAGEFAGGFFYRIRELFDLLNPAKGDPGIWGEDFEEAERNRVDLLASEYAGSGLCRHITDPAERLAHASRMVEPIYRQCRRVNRDADRPATDPARFKVSQEVQADGALLLRFLATKGVDT